MKLELVSSTYIAKELGIAGSAVGNWIRRKVLPDNLLPYAWVDHGTPYPTPVWKREVVPLFRAWYAERHPFLVKTT